MQKTDTQERALRNAIASAEMEGIHVTPEMEEKIGQLLAGKLTVVDYVAEALASNEE